MMQVPMPAALRRPAVWLVAIYAAAAFVVFYYLLQDYRAGGNEWKQADWLINNEEVFVRRGLLGSAILTAGRWTGLNPLALVALLQAALFAGSVLLALGAALRQGVSARLLAVLTVSGGFVLFWASDFQASLRKELFLFAALALLAHGATYPRLPRFHLAASLALAVTGIAAHEGLVFFLPAYLAALHFAWSEGRSAHKITVGALFVAAVAIAFVFNLAQPPLRAIDPVCRPLLESGFPPAFCQGAVEALTHTLESEMGEVRNALNGAGLFRLAYALGLCAMPFALYLYEGRRTAWRTAALLVVAVLPFFPLYLVAIDWGRWVSSQATAAMMLLLVLRARGHAPESRTPLRGWVVPLAVVASVSLSFAHMYAIPTSGAIKEVIQLLVTWP